MTPTVRDRYELLLVLGQSTRDARINSLVREIVASENEQESCGLDYSETRARIAQVHTREDIVLLCAQMREVLRAGDEYLTVMRQIRWLLAILVAFALWRAFA
jgi:hypothetical protein